MIPRGNHTYRRDEEGRWRGPCGTDANYWSCGRNRKASAQCATSQLQKTLAGITTTSSIQRRVGAMTQRTAFLCIQIAINKFMPKREPYRNRVPYKGAHKVPRGIIPCLSWMRGNSHVQF